MTLLPLSPSESTLEQIKEADERWHSFMYEAIEDKNGPFANQIAKIVDSIRMRSLYYKDNLEIALQRRDGLQTNDQETGSGIEEDIDRCKTYLENVVEEAYNLTHLLDSFDVDLASMIPDKTRFLAMANILDRVNGNKEDEDLNDILGKMQIQEVC